MAALVKILKRHKTPKRATGLHAQWTMQPPSVGLAPMYGALPHTAPIHLFGSQVAPCLDPRTSRFAPVKNRDYTTNMRLACAKEANDGSPDTALKLSISTSKGRSFEKMDNNTDKYVEYVLETAMRRGERNR